MARYDDVPSAATEFSHPIAAQDAGFEPAQSVAVVNPTRAGLGMAEDAGFEPARA